MAAVKRSIASSADDSLKKLKLEAEDQNPAITADDEIDRQGTGFLNLDDNLLFEILKHVDGRSLAMSACVSKLWSRTALDERLWELICTRHSAQVGCRTQQQLRSVVLALGGFRKLYSLYLWPLTKPPRPSTSASSSSISIPRLTTVKPPLKSNARGWGKDEVQVSLSLLSIRYFEKMNYPVKDD